MNLMFRAIAVTMLFSPQWAEACELDDCTLSDAMHAVSDPADRAVHEYAWLHHDLALARDALQRGETARALSLAHSLDQALRSRLTHVEANLGYPAVTAFHGALQTLVEKANGWPLADLDMASKEIKG